MLINHAPNIDGSDGNRASRQPTAHNNAQHLLMIL